MTGVELLERLEADRLEAEREFRSGYTLGYACGFEIGWHRGYGDSEREHERAWHVAAQKVRDTLALPTYGELQRRRGEA
jgi:hypothetical protein